MLISKIVNGVNAKLAGELLSFAELTVHLDTVVDEINAKMNMNRLHLELKCKREQAIFPDQILGTISNSVFFLFWHYNTLSSDTCSLDVSP